MNSQEFKLLGDEIELAYGYSLPAHKRVPGNVPVFGSNGQVGWHNKSTVDGPGIIIGRKGSVGEVSYTSVPFCPIDTTYYVVNKKEHDWPYLYYALRHAGLTTLNSHSTIPGLNRENAYAVSIYLPAIPKQQKIAKALSFVEASIDNQSNSIQLSQSLKHATMHKLFTCGLRGEAQKETEIGLVPESWEIQTLGKLCEPGRGAIQTGPFGSQLHSYEYQATGTPVINPTHLYGNKISHEDVPLVSNGVVERLVRHKVEVGDILFGRRGEIGRHGLVSNDEAGWLCGTGCFLVRAHNPQINNAYLSYFFSTVPIIEWLNAHAAGAIMPNLNNTILNAVPVAFPKDTMEQQEIVDILDAIDQKIDLHRRKKAVLEELFKSLLHKLMTGEIRVDDLDLSALEDMQPQAQGGAA